MATHVTETTAVLEHHMRALLSGDLEAILDDYTEESVVISRDGAFKGRAAIRSFFERGVSSLFKPGTYELFLDARTIEGDVAQIVWHAKCDEADIVHGVDTFVMHSGKIAVQTYAGKVEPH